jgi:hypothetical protein
MAIIAHIQTLEKKHAVLEQLINEESLRPMPDFAKVTQYKKQKLRIKEQLYALYRESTAA